MFQNQNSLHPRQEMGNQKIIVFNLELFEVEMSLPVSSGFLWSFFSSHPGDQLNLHLKVVNCGDNTTVHRFTPASPEGVELFMNLMLLLQFQCLHLLLRFH